MSAISFCDHRRVAVHRPLLEDELVDLDVVPELVQLLELLRERLVDVDRPLLVLRDEPGILHAVDGDPHLLLGDVRIGLDVEDVVARDVGLVDARGRLKSR